MSWQLGFLVWRDQAKLLVGVDVSFAVDDLPLSLRYLGPIPSSPPLEGCLADAPKFRELLLVEVGDVHLGLLPNELAGVHEGAVPPASQAISRRRLFTTVFAEIG